MNFSRLYRDELVGMSRSRVMHTLWIGLPVLTAILRAIQPDTEGIPLLMFVAILISSIGGTLSAVLLSTTVTNERTRGVYDLFLIRPVSRSVLLLSKFFAALSVLIVGVGLSAIVGIGVDAIAGTLDSRIIVESLKSIVMSIAGIATACSVGLLFGTLFDSVAVSAILSVYLGNQLGGIILLPGILIESLDPVLFAVTVGIALPAVILYITVRVFAKKTV